MEFDVDAGVAILERTPAVLRALLLGLPDAWTTVNEGPDTWSAYDIVGHLIEGERADWIPRARIVLAQGADRRFQTFDRFAQFRDSGNKTLAELLDEFSALRAGSLATLAGWELTEEQLSLEGIHPAFGAVTLRQLLSTWVAHDLGHIAQVTRVMAKAYRDAVGPWRAYLPIMDRPVGTVMSSRVAAGAVLYVTDVERIAAFYADALGFTLKVREEKTAVLESSGFQLIVLQAHGRQVPAQEIASPPVRRSSATLKLVFFVDNIAKVRDAAHALGGVMNASTKEWTFGEWCVCDGLDPEGNVIQVREPAK